VGATGNLGFAVQGGSSTRDANLGSSALATQSLGLLPDLVVLTDRARLLLTRQTRYDENRSTELSIQQWVIW
jgi:hypothetical protein